MERLSDGRYAAALAAETARVAAAVLDADPAGRVPTCPAWSLGQLVAHVGFGHRWAALIVETRADRPVSHDRVDDLEVPADADARSRWLESGARRLVEAVRAAGAGARVWSWSEEQTPGFWLRRITHDTLVHRVDAELAVGTAVDIDPDLAADGVSDLLDMFRVLPTVDDFPDLAALRGDGQVLHFRATDAELGVAPSWTVRRTPAGIVWDHREGAGDVVVRGRAAELLQVLSRRQPLTGSRLEVSGDAALLADW